MRHKFLVALVAGASLGGYYYSQGTPIVPYETTLVKRGSVVQEVSVTGKVESDSVVSLAFERGGRVMSEPIPVGAHVNKGAVLVRLDSSELATLRAAAMSNIQFEEANLAQLKRGSRPEDIAVSEASYESAASALRDAETYLLDKFSSVSTVADDAIFNKTDFLFENPRTLNPKVIFPSIDQKLVNKIEQARAALSDELSLVSSLDAKADVNSFIAAKENYFSNIKDYLDDLASAVNSASPSSVNSQTQIDGWKASVSLARTNVSNSISAILVAEQAYRGAESALDISEKQLALKRVGPTTESLMAQEAKINTLKATVANYDAQIAKSVIVAPFAGVVTRQDAKLGQTVPPNTQVVFLMSDGEWKITANIPEVDVAKLSVNDAARVTLDAYGADVSFKATLSSIDPAETVLGGVSTYKVTLFFDEKDERIRSGMTANIDISTDRRDGVLYVPTRAVFSQGDKKFIKIPDGAMLTASREVTTGLRGSDGSIEIMSGVEEGETIVTFEKT